MATRSLTEVFILMRNNAVQNRHIYSEQVSDDRVALVSASGSDPELGNGIRAKLPPEWIDGLEEIQYEESRIKVKLKELNTVHDKHLNRPTLDDSAVEEHAIEILTRDITQMFHRCQRLVMQINSKGRFGTLQEQKLANNVTSSLARTLQELSTQFRSGQSAYLRRLKSREERSKQYFGTGEGGLWGDDNCANDDYYDQGFTDAQLRLVEDNKSVVQQRDKEIAQIVRSIHDLSEIFKDLASMVVDQGTILDRIDYNLELTSQRVDSGLQQLQKAEKFQKNNRKMLIIMGLSIAIVFLVVVLIAVKSR